MDFFTRYVALRFENILTSSRCFYELKHLSLDGLAMLAEYLSRLPKQALLAKPNGRRPVGRPRTKRTKNIEDLGWNRLGLHPNEMMEVMKDREVWPLILKLLPLQPLKKSGQ